MTYLNIYKPISGSQMIIAKKCGWKNMEHVPVRPNIMPEGFVKIAKSETQPLRIGSKLNPNNFEVLEHIMSNNKLFKSKFVLTNLTEILETGKNYKDAKLIKTLLTPENIDKIETQRKIVRLSPRQYVKTISEEKYISHEAGLNTLFHDINILKASEILDPKGLDKLFKMNITEGKGKKILETIGSMNEYGLMILKQNTKNINSDSTLNYISSLITMQ